MAKKFIIDGIEIKKGERKRISIDMSSVYDFTDLKMPMEVVRGKENGPTLFVCSTIHGDEINGIEIVKRVLKSPLLKNIRGTLIAIPIVNIFGFNDRSRYLPDRRDLNRCFPGLKNGSLASQLAYKFMREVIKKSDYGIDLHTGAFHRCNYPHIRADITNDHVFELAKSFGAPTIINSNIRDGSLRAAATQLGIPLLLYEGGEALRFDENVIKTGVNGVLNFMNKIGMIRRKYNTESPAPFIAYTSSWVRSPNGGVHIPHAQLGQIVKIDDILGEVSSPFGDHKTPVKAHENGIIVGMSMLPLTNKGDALFHIASSQKEPSNKPFVAYYENLENIDPVNYGQ